MFTPAIFDGPPGAGDGILRYEPRRAQAASSAGQLFPAFLTTEKRAVSGAESSAREHDAEAATAHRAAELSSSRLELQKISCRNLKHF
jgi:hypothetical protein